MKKMSAARSMTGRRLVVVSTSPVRRLSIGGRRDDEARGVADLVRVQGKHGPPVEVRDGVGKHGVLRRPLVGGRDGADELVADDFLGLSFDRSDHVVAGLHAKYSREVIRRCGQNAAMDRLRS
ncbi:MAG TPA: hypothetical protein VI217_24055 [Mycobacterium sp.]